MKLLAIFLLGSTAFADVILDFGPWHFQTDSGELRVYNGEGGFGGVTFGSGEPFEQNGLSFAEYDGIYASFVAGGFLPPDDSLANVEALAGNSDVENIAYFKVNGTAEDGRFVRYQADGPGLHYHVTALDEFTRLLTMEGQFTHGENLDFWDVEAPTPFSFSMTYDLRAQDEEVDNPQLGEYPATLPEPTVFPLCIFGLLFLLLRFR